MSAVYRHAVDDALARFFDQFDVFVPAGMATEQAQWAYRCIADYTMRGGKRIRGMLGASVYDDATNQHLSDAGLQLAVALELMQSYLLIVDDVMDKSSSRRGKPTVHEQYLADFADVAPSPHEADMMAINVGLLTQHVANSVLLSNTVLADGVLRHTLLCMHRNIALTGLGQIDDLYEHISRPVKNEDAIYQKYTLKSSYYTFINPLQCGLALAGKLPPSHAKQAETYGGPAGIAFQLWDDYIGVFGNSGQSGKPNLDDVREGKYTMLVQYALHRGTTAQQVKLKMIIGNPQAAAADLAAVQDIFMQTGAVAYTQTQAVHFAGLAKSAARDATAWSAPYGKLLSELVDYCIERKQ